MKPLFLTVSLGLLESLTILLSYRPGLLGKDKYKFANMYCAVNIVQNTHGFKVTFMVALAKLFIVACNFVTYG